MEQDVQPPQKISIARLASELSSRVSGQSAGGGEGSKSRRQTGKSRSYQACEPCRRKKTKCDAERPTCKHCSLYGIECHYGYGKREKAKLAVETMQSRIKTYEGLLQYLLPQLDFAGQLAVQKALIELADAPHETKSPSPITPPVPQLSFRNERNKMGKVPTNSGASSEADSTSGGAGSTGNLDQTREELNTNDISDPTGYMGKNSEVAWIKRFEDLAQLAVRKQSSNSSARSSGQPSGSTSNQESSGVATDDRFPAGPNLHAFKLPPRNVLPEPLPGRRFALDKGNSIDGEPMLGSTYHLDDLNLSIPLARIEKELYLLPPQHILDAHFNIYFTTIHRTFPVLVCSKFMREYREYVDISKYGTVPSMKQQRWLAILNLVLATSATFSHMVKAEWRGALDDHLIYFAKARELSLNNGILEVPDMLQVQAFAIAATYLVASNQTNRSWNYIGLAIRCAQSIGLHLYSRSATLTASEKEIRVRVWCSILSLETLVKVMNGRPCAIRFEDTNVPLPHAPDEDDIFAMRRSNPNSQSQNSYSLISAETSTISSLIELGRPQFRSARNIEKSWSSEQRDDGPASSDASKTSFFPQQLRLTKIIFEALSTLYSANMMRKRWKEVEDIIQRFDKLLLHWHYALPDALSTRNDNRSEEYFQERTVLAFQFHSARLLINRPCLCNFDAKSYDLHKDATFRKQSARTCIDAARSLISFIPPVWGPEAIRLAKQGPWWALIHYIVSAAVVLMIELVYDAEHAPELAEQMLADSEKAVSFLQSMGKDNLAAKRSSETLAKMFNIIAPHLQSKGQDQQGLSHSTSIDAMSLDDPESQQLPFPRGYSRQASDEAWYNTTAWNPEYRSVYEDILGQLPTILPYEETYMYTSMNAEDSFSWHGKTSNQSPLEDNEAELNVDQFLRDPDEGA